MISHDRENPYDSNAELVNVVEFGNLVVDIF